MDIPYRTARFSWMKSIATAVITSIAVAGVVGLQKSRLDQPSLWIENPTLAVQQEQVRLRLLKETPSFGFDNLLANWVFLNFLQYYGDDEARKKTGFNLSPEYFDIITRRDPRFVGTYLFLSGSVSHQLGQPDIAVQFMKRGTEALSPEIDPLAFQIWRFMSLDQLLLLGDVPGSIYSLEKAADWVKGTENAELEPLFRQTATFLRKEPNSKPIRVLAWGAIYQQATAIGDKQTQERAKREIVTLGGKVFEKDGRLFIQPPSSEPTNQTQDQNSEV